MAEPQNDPEIALTQLLILGSLTGGAAHELNNIFGILSLRLEKVQSDFTRGAEQVSLPNSARDFEKDFGVLGRNLQRAIEMIARLQAVRKDSPGDAATPVEVLGEAVGIYLSIYERKHSVAIDCSPDRLMSFSQVSPVVLSTWILGALHRLGRRLGRGASIQITVNDAGGLVLSGEAMAPVEGVAPGTDPDAGAPEVMEQLLAERLALLAERMGAPAPEWQCTISGADPEHENDSRKIRASLVLAVPRSS